jgi:hypothetical protein
MIILQTCPQCPLLVDRIASVVSDEFFRVVSNPRPLKDRPSIRRECVAIWSSSELHWNRHQGALVNVLSLSIYSQPLAQPEPKSTKKTLTLLQSHFTYLSPRSNAKSKSSVNDEFIGEYQSLMEQDFYNFVMFEVPWIVY